MKKSILNILVVLFVCAPLAAMAQDYLPNTETSFLDLSEVHAQNPGTNFVKVFLGRMQNIDSCNFHGLYGTTNNGSHVSFDPDTGAMTINVEVKTTGEVRSTLRACAEPMPRIDYFVSYQVLKSGNKTGTVKVFHPEGFEIRYKLITQSDFIEVN